MQVSHWTFSTAALDTTSMGPCNPSLQLTRKVGAAFLGRKLSSRAGRKTVSGSSFTWVLVKEFNLSYHNKETILFTIDPQYGNLN